MKLKYAILTLLLFWTGVVLAQEVKFTAQVSKTTVGTGEQFQVDFTVNGNACNGSGGGTTPTPGTTPTATPTTGITPTATPTTGTTPTPTPPTRPAPGLRHRRCPPRRPPGRTRSCCTRPMAWATTRSRPALTHRGRSCPSGANASSSIA